MDCEKIDQKTYKEIKITRKITFIAQPCYRMDISKGIGACEGYCYCDNLKYLLEGIYFDCEYGE